MIAQNTISIFSSKVIRKVVSVATNDYQIVPRFTTYNISLNSVPPIIQQSIYAIEQELDTKIEADRDRITQIENGKNTQFVLVKNAQKLLVGEFETYKAQMQNAISGIINDKLSKATSDEAIASARTALLSQISQEYATLAYLSQDFYTKARANEAIASSKTAILANIDDIDAKYAEAIEVQVSTDGTAKSKKIEELNASTKTLSSSIKIVETATAGIKNGDEAYIWTNASKTLVSNFNGVKIITGFDMISGVEKGKTISAISFTADKFFIQTSTTRKTPFSIDGDNILFNGKVTFSNVTNVPSLGSTPNEVVGAINAGNTTTIDGAKITTGTIMADKIVSNSITTDKLKMNIGWAGAIYNNGADSSNYSMKIDFSTGEIHIK